MRDLIQGEAELDDDEDDESYDEETGEPQHRERKVPIEDSSEEEEDDDDEEEARKVDRQQSYSPAILASLTLVNSDPRRLHSRGRRRG